MDRRQQAFSILEIVITLSIVSVLAAVGVWNLTSTLADTRARSAARSIADLLVLARGEAIRSGTPHLVFFGLDAAGAPLTGAGGQAAAGVVIRDDNADGLVDPAEIVAAIPLEASPTLAWGSALAMIGKTAAPDDNPNGKFPESGDFVCCSFTQPGGDSAARWVAFLPDGTPRAFTTLPFAAGDIASGNGSVYLTSGSRDYAVVVAALGGVRLHAWNQGINQWTR